MRAVAGEESLSAAMPSTQPGAWTAVAALPAPRRELLWWWWCFMLRRWRAEPGDLPSWRTDGQLASCYAEQKVRTALLLLPLLLLLLLHCSRLPELERLLRVTSGPSSCYSCS
jgi:hypothetical protein